jgi:hypothetical protein
VALAEQQPYRAETAIAPALAIVQQRSVPLAAWRVYAAAARVHALQRRPAEAQHAWQQSAELIRQAAHAMARLGACRQAFLSQAGVQLVLQHASTASMTPGHASG